MEEILTRIAALAPGRKLIAVSGPPGSGKSTFAAALAAALSGAVLVPMDGFHLDDRLLIPAGLRAVKGAPETFDAEGFVAMIRRLRAGEALYYPVFDRSREIAIAGAGYIDARTGPIVVEGNYLLLDQDPWRALAPLWDLSIRLEETVAELERRLTLRWQDLGKDSDAVAAHLRNDLANARLVMAQSLPADLVMRLSDETP